MNFKVMVVSQTPPPIHGSTMMTVNLLSVLREAGIDCDLIDKRFSRRVDSVGRMSLSKVLAVPSLLWRIARGAAAKPDVCIYFTTNRFGSFLVDFAAILLLHCMRVRVINYVHTRGYSELARRAWPLDRICKFIFGRAAKTVALGEGLAKELHAWTAPDTIAIVPNFAAVPVATPAPRDAVLFLSNLLAEKGPVAFAELAKRLAPSNPGIRFVLAGPPSDLPTLERVREIQRSMDDPSKLDIVGAVDSGAKYELLSKARVLVFPSTYRLEAQPLTIIESFAVGTPVVAFDVGGVSDLVSDATGSLVTAGDTERLNEAVVHLLTNESAFEAKSGGAYAAFLESYTREVYLSRWLNVLSQFSPTERTNDAK
ncbi:glycosyltransferase family 4 protein [Microbacterium enclense]|uniref:glycosyltransferase family 4 protein n=1 Tax=Microbacterium enclense TaxID=993073 RepID=UPI0036DABF07